MNKDNKLTNNKVDSFIKGALEHDPKPQMSDTFIDELMRKVERRMLQKQLLWEWSSKILIVIVALSSLLAVFYYFQEGAYVDSILSHFPVVLFIIGIGLSVFFIDQVVLRFMLYWYKKKR